MNEEKKRIFIFSHFMDIGGAEKALLGLLEGIDLSQYEVDLFLLRHEGCLMKYIPECINILPEIKQYTMLAKPIKELVKERHLLIAAARLFGKMAAKIYELINQYDAKSAVEIEYSHKFTQYLMPKLCCDKVYDLAISFLTPHYFVTKKIQSKIKIAWIHTDYSSIQINKKSEYKMWEPYDYIASISEECSNAFTRVFPKLKRKIVLIENPLPVKMIIQQSEYKEKDLPQKKNDEIILLSIGRFCEAKNFENIPNICKRIREKGCNVKWYIIGFGAGEQLIRKRIIECNMQEWVIILGKKENPYPYIKFCDWYIQPSKFEGKAVTVQEAQILNKPVIITDYATSQSQLKNGIDGVIVPLDNYNCAYRISEIIENISLKNTLINNTKNSDYSGKKSIETIYRLMEVKNDT